MNRLNANTAPGGTPSGTIVWTGEDIPCLGICNGMSINKLLYIVASKVCELSDPYDLSKLTIQCALDLFDVNEPATRTIGNLFQLAFDNDCGLKELIDNLQAQIDGISKSNFVVNLKCLAQKDSFGNTLNYTEESVIQLLIDKLCDLISDFDGVSGTVADLQSRIEAIENAPKVIEENSVTTCLFTNKPVSQAIVLVSTDYCRYKGFVGVPTQIQSAIALQPADFNTIFSSNTAWVTMPSSMAQSLANVWTVLANHESRIQATEKCCAPSCEDVKVGYEIIMSADGKSIALKFSRASGTYIPSGLDDQGSTIIITDKNGSVLSYNVEITQDGVTDDLSVIGLDTSAPLVIDMTAKIGSDSFGICTQCVPAKSFNADGSCPICLISVGADKFSSGSVVITYKI